jgi:hypothetical protein
MTVQVRREGHVGHRARLQLAVPQRARSERNRNRLSQRSEHAFSRMPAGLLRIQRQIGNRAFAELVEGPGLSGSVRTGPDVIQRVRVKKGDSAPMDKKKMGKDVPAASDIEAWKPAWAGIDETLSDQARMDALIANFKANRMGFKYFQPNRTWALNGDCGNLARTFIALAENVLQVQGDLAVGYHNGAPGWYVAPGVREIDSTRLPNVEGGGYYFFTSHVWVTWNGTVYDVLFGEKGQNGRVAEDAQYVGEGKAKARCFRIGDQWFRPAGHNTYAKAQLPTDMNPDPAPVERDERDRQVPRATTREAAVVDRFPFKPASANHQPDPRGGRAEPAWPTSS